MRRLRSVARFKIHPGKTDEFKRLSTQCMQRAREKDTGTLAYEIYFNADETECVVYEEYESSEASIQHFANMGELAPAIFAIVDATGEMWGEPSPELRGALEQHGVKILKPFLSFND